MGFCNSFNITIQKGLFLDIDIQLVQGNYEAPVMLIKSISPSPIQVRAEKEWLSIIFPTAGIMSPRKLEPYIACESYIKILALSGAVS